MSRGVRGEPERLCGGVPHGRAAPVLLLRGVRCRPEEVYRAAALSQEDGARRKGGIMVQGGERLLLRS